MAEFEYHVKDAEGRPVVGQVEADDIEQAIASLARQGLTVRAEDLILLVGGSDAQEVGEAIVLEEGTAVVVAEVVEEEPKLRLSGREIAQLVDTVADLTSADLPLSAGLRASAEEIPQRRVARAMRRMAAELDRGVSLEMALGAASKSVPGHLRGLILAGLRTGRVAHVLEELVAMDHERVDLRRRIVTALTYPLILFFMLFASFVFANLFIVRPFARIFEDFGMELPSLTLMMIAMMNWFDHSGFGTLLITVAIVVPAFVILLLVPKTPELQRACYLLPVFGPLWRWQSLVDFSRLMHLLLERQVPMAESLRLTADGLRWADLAEVSRACAADVDKGMGLTEAMARYPAFPASMRPVIESGLRSRQPAEAFGAAADMYRRRAGVDATLWEAILPPMILVFVAVGLGFLIISMFLPLIKLISSLT